MQVTASNSDKSIVLETDVPLQHREVETEKHVKAARAAMVAGARPPGSALAQELGTVVGSILEDFVERVWGFLSVKEGLRSRLRSQTSREREDHTQQATNLALTYNFLTPLTNLVVEKPSISADGTMAPPPTTVSTTNEVPGPLEAPEGAGSRPPTPSNTLGKVKHPPAGCGKVPERRRSIKAALTHRMCKYYVPFRPR